MAKDPPLLTYEEKTELMGSIGTNIFSQRLARFLIHDTKTLNEPAPLFESTNQSNSKPFFKGWKLPPIKWAEWVDRMAGIYSAVWIKSGIFDSIVSSIYEIPCNYDLISALLQFWNPKTNTFVFPWGEATITLEDVTILGGYSVLGDSVSGDSSIAVLGSKIETMDRFRSELVKGKAKKALHSKWIQMFMMNQNEIEHEDEIEHIAFLTLWVSRFVLPSLDRNSVGKHVIPIAVKLSQGFKLALAPAILASIYHSLTKLKEQSVHSSSNRGVNLSVPFQLVQIWGYERFPVVGPKTPNDLSPGEPRLARWHALNSNYALPVLHSHMINHESFIWRPYVVDLENWKQPSYHQDSHQILSDSVSLNDDSQSFVRFITPCEVNGVCCQAKYHPHRVSMQFGFDQDIPSGLSSYKVSNFGKLLVPSRLFRPGISKRYFDWWNNVNQTGFQNDQDLVLDEGLNESVECGMSRQEDCGNSRTKSNDFEFVDLTLEDEFDDILVSLKRICNATKRKLDSLKESYGAPQGKKKSELGNGMNNVIIID